MSKPNDGGPAFPRTGEVVGKPGESRDVAGMSLRDYFAAKAMQAIIAKFPPQTSNVGIGESDLMKARGAYEYADAMLAERAKGAAQ